MKEKKKSVKRVAYITGIAISGLLLLFSLGSIYLQRYSDGSGMYVGSLHPEVCHSAGILPGQVCTGFFHRDGGGMCDAVNVSVYTSDGGTPSEYWLRTYNPITTCGNGVWVPSPLLELKLASQIATTTAIISGAATLLFAIMLIRLRKS